MAENCGQRICILCNAAFRFNELNVLLASTNMTASVCSSSKISFMECMAASATDWRPVAICNGSAASWISFLIAHPMHFPIILRITSPTPIGRTPGFLLRGISRHATRASTNTDLLFQMLVIWLIELSIVLVLCFLFFEFAIT